MNIYSTGENVFLGRAGHAFIIIAFVAAIVSAIAYAIAAQKRNEAGASVSWKQLGRNFFIIHAVSVLGMVSILLMIIHGHYFEYKYAWQHSSKELPFKYLLAAFWEGQEGSTMLWLFWHVVLGLILLFRSKQFEAPVMFMLSCVQFLLVSMILGVFVFGYKMGSNPFALMKDVMDIPIFKMNPDWVPENGSGLNPLLQNYWMVIHPPTLFLGFAATTIPFCYAFGALWFRDYDGWTRPVLPWALFAIGILGTGVLMGGAWAYEALSFGGFWAWDPVENASLVPWIILVAGLHTLLIYRHTGYSLFITFALFIAAFLLILYSTFLTKSGVLGDSSVHSFTDMGMSGQLLVTIGAFLVPSIVLLIIRYKEIPGKKEEEQTWSREFWMFVGSLVLIFSALHITIVTSFPVINKYLHTNLAPPSDIGRHYNGVQIWIAVLIALGTAVVQFFKYKNSDARQVLRGLAISFLLAVLFTLLVIIPYKLYRPDHISMALFAWFALFANIQYFIAAQKGKIIKAGGSIAHVGFAMMLLGILISQARQEVISLNRYGLDYGGGFTEKDNEENILLYEDVPELMKNHWQVTYVGDSVANPTIYYNIRFEKLAQDGKVERSFLLTPNILINKQMGNSPNPSTHRAIHRDIYTHVTMAPLKEDGSMPDSIVRETATYAVGDTIFANRSFAILEAINPHAQVKEIEQLPGDIAIGAKLKVFTNEKSDYLEPVYYIRDMMATSFPASSKEPEVKFTIERIIPEEGKLEITVEQPVQRFVILKAIIFPYINLLWLGSFIMVAGIFISIRKRRQDNKRAVYET